ncbi:hypothetical protein K491DRAFT_713808 [Lophiostoma macrostomum CBS 122681]|uniref:Uncharacterized protein n=1 Tax=Lophiostoma macrostomum CBS 122681 TaxID=1314788 RepID=A0A6A6TFY1_9PLEO|nr:hypothetical protein K491DRAFT_713808 [Lophiostoma macrostomum CBS 122681]
MERKQSRTKGPVCGIENCRSRRYEEGEDGYLYCQNGHRKGNLQFGEDEGDFDSSARTTTRKKKDDEYKEVHYKYYRGHQATDLYLKCLQLILRHQVRGLVHDKGLPAELESVVLDLWSLRLLQLEDRVSKSRSYDSQSEFSSASESETGQKKRPLQGRDGKLKSTPGLVDCLALCYLGIITLRLPITPGDIHAWATNADIPYLKAIKYVPHAMREKLSSNYAIALEPNSLLKYEKLYVALNGLGVSLKTEFGIVWPSLNYPLLLFRYLKELALPLELYDATLRLAGYLGYKFIIPESGPDRLSVRNLPEAQLAACLIVCVKLMYPFDGPKRYPVSSSEPAAALINWDRWCKHIVERGKGAQGSAPTYTAEVILKLQEKDVFTMSSNQLDRYLDWYQDTFVDEFKVEDGADGAFRRTMCDMFPIDSNSTAQTRPIQTAEASMDIDHMGTVKAVHADFKPVMVVEQENERPDTIRPGHQYKFYKHEKQLPEQAHRLYELTAKSAGLSMDMLVLAVFFAEKGAQKWMIRQRRRR